MCITETLKKIRKLEAAFGSDLQEGFLIEIGLDVHQVRTLARMGEIRFLGSVK